MSKSFYKFACGLLRVLMFIIYPFRQTGRENVPEGPVLVCANHSSFLDPIFVGFAVSNKYPLYFMAKQELIDVPVLGWALKKIGVISVKRDASDLGAIRSAIRLLKNGEKVMLFPEGTRVKDGETITPKSGGIRIAAKVGAQVLPVHVPRNKRLFHMTKVTIGEPYELPREIEDFDACAQELMDKIYSLGSAQQ